MAIFLVVLAASVAALAPAFAQEEIPSQRKRLVENVTTEDVKRFLDPTRMISRVSYDFQMNYLPTDVELMTHRLKPWLALSNSQAIWVEIPYLDFSLPLPGGPSGLGDMAVGWGIILHENNRKRLTTITTGLEVLLPTGDADRGLSADKTVVSPGLAVATNPTDVFPVYITTWYHHSIETEGASQRPGRPVRAFDIGLQTFHILPQGFFLAFLPTLVIDLEGDFNIFSLGLGAGRALNRRLLIQGGYVQYVAGEKTFNRGFTVGVTWLWGKDQGRR